MNWQLLSPSITRLTQTAAAVMVLAPAAASCQAVQASQSAAVSQWIAEAHFELEYDRPVARGRDLFGSLVPWNEIWSPSANLALRFSVSSDVLLAGEPLPAGDYSLWLEPRPEGTWRVLFNSEFQVAHNVIPEEGWVLELEIEPRAASYMEAMAVYFSNANYREGAFDLHWGGTAIRVPIEVPGR